MDLPKDFKEFIDLLNEKNVKYLVIGGYAVNIHGYPRYTRDIDFWIWLDRSNIDRLLDTLKAFGFGSLGLEASQFEDPEEILQLGYEPNRIDILMGVNGVDFNDCYARKKVSTLSGSQVNFLAIDD